MATRRAKYPYRITTLQKPCRSQQLMGPVHPTPDAHICPQTAGGRPAGTILCLRHSPGVIRPFLRLVGSAPAVHPQFCPTCPGVRYRLLTGGQCPTAPIPLARGYICPSSSRRSADHTRCIPRPTRCRYLLEQRCDSH